MSTPTPEQALGRLTVLARDAAKVKAAAAEALAKRDAAMLACASMQGVRIQDVADAAGMTKDRVGQVLRRERARTTAA